MFNRRCDWVEASDSVIVPPPGGTRMSESTPAFRHSDATSPHEFCLQATWVSFLDRLEVSTRGQNSTTDVLVTPSVPYSISEISLMMQKHTISFQCGVTQQVVFSCACLFIGSFYRLFAFTPTSSKPISCQLRLSNYIPLPSNFLMLSYFGVPRYSCLPITQ